MHGPTIPHSIDELEKLGVPNRGVEGNMEVLWAPLYDTQTYVDATTTSLTFFQQADTGSGFLTNMTQGGQLPNPEIFMPYYVTLDILGQPPADGGPWADTYNLLFGTGLLGAPYATFAYATKRYPNSGGYPLSAIPGSGGVTGFGASLTAGEEYANNGHPGSNGLPLGIDPDGNSAITILPLKAFSWQLRWSAPVDIAADRQIRLTMWGAYYREIR